MCGAFLLGGHGHKPVRSPEKRIGEKCSDDDQTTLIERRNGEEQSPQEPESSGNSGNKATHRWKPRRRRAPVLPVKH